MKRLSEALARFIERRPWWIIAVSVMLVAASVPGITMLKTETGFDTLVSSSSSLSQDNQRYEEQFGAEPITVLLSGQLSDVFSTRNLEILRDFTGEVSADSRYRSITSPLDILLMAIDEANAGQQAFQEQLALAQETAAEKARQDAASAGLSEAQQEEAAAIAQADVIKEFQPQIEELQRMGEPSLDNPLFVAAVLYEADGTINEAVQSFIPDDEHVLIAITPRGNMEDSEALQASEDIETFFTSNPLVNTDVTVIADTKLVDAISRSMGGNITLLFGLSVGVMVLILLVMFRVRLRLLSLLMVGIGALWTFGLAGYLSIPLNMATMAVLPILIGLGIDYSIQFQNRYQEEITRSRSVGEATITSISRMFFAVGIALLATIIGFITLYISRVPMIRDFGMLLALGVIVCFIASLFLLHSILYLGDKRVPLERLSKASKQASGRIERILAKIAQLAVSRTLPIFLVSLAFAVTGGVVDHWLPVNTNYEDLMPQDMEELVELRELREIVGNSSKIHFMVEADDVTSPEVLTWLTQYQDTAIRIYPELVSVDSLTGLLTQAAGGELPGPQLTQQILAGTPSLLRDQLVSPDHSMASVTFSTTPMSLGETNDILRSLEDLAIPPEGVRIAPVGTMVLGASTIDAVVGTRFTMNLLCLGAVLVVLLLVYRRISTVIFTLIPVGAVIAWSSLDMFLIGIPLNPLTAVLGVIIIGICTEFMVLLFGRYNEERQKGQLPRDAMITAIAKIGRAIVTTAMTTLGGFAVLIASDFVMIRDFGIATVLGVFLCLISSLTVMPGLIVWYDEWRARRTAGKTG